MTVRVRLSFRARVRVRLTLRPNRSARDDVRVRDSVSVRVVRVRVGRVRGRVGAHVMMYWYLRLCSRMSSGISSSCRSWY